MAARWLQLNFQILCIWPSELDGLWLRYATLQNWIPSFPWIAPPHPPPWRNPRKGRDPILPSGNTGREGRKVERERNGPLGFSKGRPHLAAALRSAPALRLIYGTLPLIDFNEKKTPQSLSAKCRRRVQSSAQGLRLRDLVSWLLQTSHWIPPFIIIIICGG